ncbi:MAG: amino acid permease, partial [Mycobacterium sp.]
VGAVVAVLAGLADLRAAIGFSSFAVLIYYAVANAAAWTLGHRLVPATGLAGCLLIAVFLPASSVLTGVAVLAAGAAGYAALRLR